MRYESLNFDQTQLMSEKRKKIQPNQWQRFLAPLATLADLSPQNCCTVKRRQSQWLGMVKLLATTDFPDGEVMRPHQHSESQLAKLGSQLLSCARLASDFPMIVRDV